jgi:hypothetical protein
MDKVKQVLIIRKTHPKFNPSVAQIIVESQIQSLRW